MFSLISSRQRAPDNSADRAQESQVAGDPAKDTVGGLDVAPDETNLGPGCYTCTPTPPHARRPINTAVPFYSRWLAEKLNLRHPEEQYGLWGTLAGSATYATQNLDRARALINYVKTAESDLINKRWWSQRANVAPQELENAGYHAKRFTRRALAVAIGAPLLYFAWRMYKAETEDDKPDTQAAPCRHRYPVVRPH
ncbi:hypothetical protein WJX72_004947 [[Myrmecia] bisecta]|uniref:Uncharacterized protein n=1 Tax=[Myrmecia] bisecta TaxID=41462 RepID=A0AAW1Q1P8_9CHLO